MPFVAILRNAGQRERETSHRAAGQRSYIDTGRLRTISAAAADRPPMLTPLLARQKPAAAEYYANEWRLRVNLVPNLLRTGIPLIDRQHAAYEELTSRVLALCTEPRTTRETLAIEVAHVRSYALDHFDCEEQLMRSIKYPYYDGHVTKHNVFREQSDDFAAEVEIDPLASDFTVRLARLLVDWFCVHVQTEDMKLAAFLRESGQVPAS